MKLFTRAHWPVHLLHMLVFALVLALGVLPALTQAMPGAGHWAHQVKSEQARLATAAVELQAPLHMHDGGSSFGAQPCSPQGVQAQASAAVQDSQCQAKSCDDGQCARLCALSTAAAPFFLGQASPEAPPQVLHSLPHELVRGIVLSPETPPPIA